MPHQIWEKAVQKPIAQSMSRVGQNIHAAPQAKHIYHSHTGSKNNSSLQSMASCAPKPQGSLPGWMQLTLACAPLGRQLGDLAADIHVLVLGFMPWGTGLTEPKQCRTPCSRRKKRAQAVSDSSSSTQMLLLSTFHSYPENYKQGQGGLD